MLKHGKHVATAVPAVFGSLEEADKLYEAVKTSGLNYMMFETSCFHDDLLRDAADLQRRRFGKLVYSEGEYYHYMPDADRLVQGLAHRPAAAMVSDALERLLRGRHRRQLHRGLVHGDAEHHRAPAAGEQRYKNPFGTEIALFRTSEGGMSRMARQLGHAGPRRRSRPRSRAEGLDDRHDVRRPGQEAAEPRRSRRCRPTVDPGGHGGSHGYLGNEFVTSILENRKPLVNVAWALNMTVAGIVAHQSALKDGELMKIPQYRMW